MTVPDANTGPPSAAEGVAAVDAGANALGATPLPAPFCTTVSPPMAAALVRANVPDMGVWGKQEVRERVAA